MPEHMRRAGHDCKQQHTYTYTHDITVAKVGSVAGCTAGCVHICTLWFGLKGGRVSWRREASTHPTTNKSFV